VSTNPLDLSISVPSPKDKAKAVAPLKASTAQGELEATIDSQHVAENAGLRQVGFDRGACEGRFGGKYENGMKC